MSSAVKAAGVKIGGTRLEALRQLLRSGALSTQEDLCEQLKGLKFDVTQSTVSRDLRKVGAIKVLDNDGRTVYRLSEELTGGLGEVFEEPLRSMDLSEMVLELSANGALIVIRTPPGSASWLARHLDRVRPKGVLGTIAGDDTIFVAISREQSAAATSRAIRESLK